MPSSLLQGLDIVHSPSNSDTVDSDSLLLSASAPTFAGFVALLNDARIKAGLPPLGFLNPLIYAIGKKRPGAFNDITTGHNPGCGTQGFNVSGILTAPSNC